MGGPLQSRWLGGQLVLYPSSVRGYEWHVDSVNGSDNNSGKDWDNPLATIAAGVAKCTASQGDRVWLAPGHYEDLADAQIDLATAGITIEGLGIGTDRPRIDFNHANASLNLGANNIRLRNIGFRPSVAAVLVGVDIEAGSTGCIVEDCEFMLGEAGDGTDEFVLGIDLKAGCDDTIIRNNAFRTHASCNGATHAVKLTGASDNVTVAANVMRGIYSAAAIGGDGTLSTNILLEDNLLQPKDTEPGIEMLTGTTGVIRRNHILTNLATVAASIVCDQAYLFDNKYCEVVTETGGLVGTESAND